MSVRQRVRGSARREARRPGRLPTTLRADPRVLMLLALVAAATCVYLPVLEADFINWDDPVYVTMNQHIRTLSWDTVRWALTDHETASLWHPLTWLSLALDYRLHGLTARG